MIQQRNLVILGLAILLGLAAVFVANTYLTGVQRRDEAAQGPATVQVLVARVPIEFGGAITPEKVKTIAWPRESVPAGSFNWIGQLSPLGKTRVALRAIDANEPITAGKLSGEGGRATIAALLRPDMRAAAVRVSDVAAVGGFVLPGDTVDVLVTRQASDGGASGQQITDVLLQGVRVLAIDQNASDAMDKAVVGRTATLEVDQLDAQKLALAQTVGALTLVLRKIDDPAMNAVQTVDSSALRDGAFAGSYRGPEVTDISYPTSAPVAAMPLQRRRRAVSTTVPVLQSTASVEVVRGVQGTSYEVKPYGR